MSDVRVLIVVRLSNLTDETTSPARQLSVCKSYAEARGWSVVGVAEDLDVSASTTSPFDRPSLRSWLDRHHDYDVILFWRVDRLVRRVTHLASMIEWSEEHAVNLVSATESHFDLSTGVGQALAIMVGVFAQMEAEAISARSKQSFDHLRKEGRYRGGHPPTGYRPEKDEHGNWRLVIDPATGPLVQSLVERVIDGERPTTICADLNRREVQTPHDHFRQSRGKPTKGQLWRPGNLTRLLRSPTLLGQVIVTNGTKDGSGRVRGVPEVVRGDDGTPIVTAKPLLTRVEFDRLQAALDSMNGKRGAYKTSTALLLRVLTCGECGRAMYLNKGGRGTTMYYRCASASLGLACGNKAIRQGDADRTVTKMVLTVVGDQPRMRREFDPGSDVTAELADVDAELVDVAGLIGTGPFKAGPARERLEARAEALSARRDVLAAQEQRPAGYRLVPTGETVSEHWHALPDDVARNVFLRETGLLVRHSFDSEHVFSFHGEDIERLVGVAMGVPGEMQEEARSES